MLCLLAAAPVLILAWLARAEDALLDRSRQAERTLSLYEERLAALPSRDAAMAKPPADTFVGGETLAVAGADLRRRTISIVSDAQGRMVESELMQAASDIEGAELVRLRVAVTGPNDAVQRILFDLEAMRPPAVLSAVTIQAPGLSRISQAPDDEEPTLSASFVLDAYRKAGTP